jgi:hypothetical protein
MKLRRLLLTCNYLKLSDGIILSIVVKSLIEVVLFIFNVCCNNRTESYVTISATRYHLLSRFFAKPILQLTQIYQNRIKPETYF